MEGSGIQDNGRSPYKPNILILGGCGFIGRNLVQYLVEERLASKIVVADKVMPSMAYLNNRHKEAFQKVQFKHTNLINPQSVASVFDSNDFDYAINCAGETKFEQTHAVYEDGVFKLSCNCAEQAAKHRVKRYVEIGTAILQCSDKRPLEEGDGTVPFTDVGRFKLRVEQHLKTIPDLDYVILRPVIVYGPGDRLGLTPRLVIGSIYRYLEESLQILWSKDLRVNTVHVEDVARAAWHVCTHGQSSQMYHLSDHGNSTQGTLANLIAQIFGINYEFIGSMMSHIVKLSDIVDEINSKHIVAWGELCRMKGIQSTPLSPVIYEELVSNKEIHVNGTKIEDVTGFEYRYQSVTEGVLRQVLEDYVQMGLFPEFS